jgi:hypothetical protein
MGESSLGEIGTQQSKSLSANVNASLDVIGSYESSSKTEEENYMGEKRTVTKVDKQKVQGGVIMTLGVAVLTLALTFLAASSIGPSRP